jgi:hypothetical protein
MPRRKAPALSISLALRYANVQRIRERRRSTVSNWAFFSANSSNFSIAIGRDQPVGRDWKRSIGNRATRIWHAHSSS